MANISMASTNGFGDDPSLERLYEQRKGAANPQASEDQKLRFFQLIADYQYPYTEKLANQTLLLHSHQAGGFGDVSQNFLCAKQIVNKHPGVCIEVLLQLETVDKDQINAVFPVDRFKTHFLEYGFHESEKQFEDLMGRGSPLGIAQGVTSSGVVQAKYPHLRTIREYGFSWHPDVKKNMLSMGLEDREEGISFPKIESRALVDLKSAWLKNALGIGSQEDQVRYASERTLYHMYMSSWTTQVTALYSVAAIEQNSLKPIDLFIPIKYSLQQLKDWRILDEAYLTQLGIGRIIRITPQGQETLEIGAGKELRLFSGALPKMDMEAIQQHAQPFFGCTGDGSFSEAVALNKVPFYDAVGHKIPFLRSWKKLAEQRDLKLFAEFLGQTEILIQAENKAYEKNTPKKTSWYSTDPSYELSDQGSVARKAAPELAVTIREVGERVAQMYLNPKLSEEALALNQHILRNYNFEPRLMGIVRRALVLQNYPNLISVEQNLWEKFKGNAISEVEVARELSSAIYGSLGQEAPVKTDLNK